jgi:hypothetical protein
MLQLVRSLKRALATEASMATKLQDLQEIITAHSGEEREHSPHPAERSNSGTSASSTVGGLFARRFRATARATTVAAPVGGAAVVAGAAGLPESTQSVAVAAADGETSEGGARQSGGGSGGGFGDGPVLTLEELQRGMSLEVGNMSAITEEDGPHSNGDPYVG